MARDCGLHTRKSEVEGGLILSVCNVKTSLKCCTGIRDRGRPAGTCLKTFIQHDYAQQAALHRPRLARGCPQSRPRQVEAWIGGPAYWPRRCVIHNLTSYISLHATGHVAAPGGPARRPRRRASHLHDPSLQVRRVA